MTAGAMAIGPGARVTLHFALQLESGEEIDTTRRGRPAVFEVGDGKLLPGFEAALAGLVAGDDRQIALPPEQAFGPRRQENVHLLERAQFEAADLEPGTVVAFKAPDGQLPGVVKEVFERTVEVDFNHPLAGRTIVFDVSIIRVEPGTGEDRSSAE